MLPIAAGRDPEPGALLRNCHRCHAGNVHPLGGRQLGLLDRAAACNARQPRRGRQPGRRVSPRAAALQAGRDQPGHGHRQDRTHRSRVGGLSLSSTLQISGARRSSWPVGMPRSPSSISLHRIFSTSRVWWRISNSGTHAATPHRRLIPAEDSAASLFIPRLRPRIHRASRRIISNRPSPLLAWRRHENLRFRPPRSSPTQQHGSCRLRRILHPRTGRASASWNPHTGWCSHSSCYASGDATALRCAHLRRHGRRQDHRFARHQQGD